MRRSDRVLLAGLGAAYIAFAVTFRGPRDRFWQRMTKTGLTLGGLALAAEPALRVDLRRSRSVTKTTAIGIASAGALYGIFQVGDRLARRLLPKGGEQIGEVYALRRLRPGPELAARLALVIGPAEELFWRGFVRRRLAERFGRWRGSALAAATYGGAHVVTGNLTLTGAATTAGAFWSALAAADAPMASLIVSHIVWDLWIFLIAPTASVSA
jgi:membrane protease YdiL (CAAX protease family)